VPGWSSWTWWSSDKSLLYSARALLIVVFAWRRQASNGLGARDDLDQFLRDHRLTGAVIAQRQLVDHLAGISCGSVHSRHTRTLLAGRILQKSPEDLDRDIPWQEIIQDLRFFRLILVYRAAEIQLGSAVFC